MKLNDKLIEGLASMVTGDNSLFPYRSSSYITRFFERCGIPFVHDGSTRRIWVQERLADLNLGVCHNHDLPSDDLLHVIAELLEPDDFEEHNKRRSGQASGDLIAIDTALVNLNKLLRRVAHISVAHICLPLANVGLCHPSDGDLPAALEPALSVAEGFAPFCWTLTWV